MEYMDDTDVLRNLHTLRKNVDEIVLVLEEVRGDVDSLSKKPKKKFAEADHDHPHEHDYADPSHKHEGVAMEDHSHPDLAKGEHSHSDLAPKEHGHSDLAPREHEHSSLAKKKHEHPDLAKSSHDHTEYVKEKALSKALSEIDRQIHRLSQQIDNLILSNVKENATPAKPAGGWDFSIERTQLGYIKSVKAKRND